MWFKRPTRGSGSLNSSAFSSSLLGIRPEKSPSGHRTPFGGATAPPGALIIFSTCLGRLYGLNPQRRRNHLSTRNLECDERIGVSPSKNMGARTFHAMKDICIGAANGRRQRLPIRQREFQCLSLGCDPQGRPDRPSQFHGQGRS